MKMNKGEIIKQLNTRLRPGQAYILLSYVLSETYDDKKIEELIQAVEKR